MEMSDLLEAQYSAALNMLEQVVRKCPEALWADSPHKNPTWHVAYHALFYTHLYLQPSMQSFRPWAKHRDGYHRLGLEPGQLLLEPYSQADVLEYLQFCREQVSAALPGQDWEAPSGFEWLHFNQLEKQVYNIRHLQQHTGELCERLFNAGVDVDWVGQG